MAARVLIVQHGDKRREPGDPGLTELGRAQAQATAARLVPAQAPVAVWSSPLRRARETAAPIAAAARVEVRIDERLRERANWQGPAEQPLDAFLADWRRASTDRDYAPPGGDSSHRAAERFLAALDDIATAAVPPAHGDGTVVVVAHGGVTVDALRTLLGDRALAQRAPTLVAEGVPSGALTAVSREDGSWQVESIAVTTHLDAVSGHRPA